MAASFANSLGWLSVRQFDATGDGTTDDTAAFQAAVDAVPAAGGTVYIPTPSVGYRINGTITNTTPNVRIIGDGNSSIILKESTTADLFNFTPAVTPTDSDDPGLEGIVFQDISIQPYAATNHTAGTCIRVQWSKGTVIESVQIGTYMGYDGTPPYLYDGVRLDQQSTCLIHQCHISTRHYGVALSGQGFLSGELGPSGFPHYGFNGIVDACTIYNNAVASSVGILIGGGTGGVALHHTDIGRWANGIRFDKTMRNEVNREVFIGPGCFADSSGVDGVLIAASSLLKFHAVDFWSAGSGQTSTGHGFNMSSTQDSDFRGIITGGRVYANTGDGLRLDAGRWTVTGVDVHTNTGNGIHMSGGSAMGDCVITGCKVTGNTGTGVLTTTGQNNYVITANMIRSNTAANFTDTAAGANKLVTGNLTS